jgi:glycosyltransferase involved in cell wall biosynthesis
MREAPFHYPAATLDGLRVAVGGLERLLGLLGRRVRSRQTWLQRSDIGRSAAALRVGQPWLGSAAGQKNREAAPLPPILFFPALPWLYRFQRPQQLALALARQGYPVLYIEGFGRARALPARRASQIGDHLHLLRLGIPGRPDPFRETLPAATARTVADWIADGLQSRPLMLLVQLPFWTPVGTALSERLSVPLVYDRIDLHSSFPGVPASVDDAEAVLLATADLVTASADDLVERSRPLARRVQLLRNAVALEDFALAGRPLGSRRRIGYVGALGPWFEAEAVRAAALVHSQAEFLLAGEVEDAAIATLAELPNVRLLGEIPYRDVPRFLASLDAALIPFRPSALTKAVDPVKLYEALATGLPVVARELPEIRRWVEPAVYAYREAAEMAGKLTAALAQDTDALRAGRRNLVLRETWDARAEVLLAQVAAIVNPA